MKADLLVRGTIVTSDALLEGGWIAVQGGTIAAIGTGEALPAKETFDAGVCLVMPGVVDGQTHAGSYGGLKGIASTTRSAVAGGITTIVDMPYDNPAPLSDLATLQAKVEAIGQHAHANVALYATIMPNQSTADVQALIEAGVVAFKISAFESSSTRFPRIPADRVLDLFEALSGTDIPLGIHNEDQEIVRARIARARANGRDGIEAHSESRPPAAELGSTAHFLELGAATGAHAHIVHLTSARGFQLVENYRNDGYRATGELCVHYLWFDPATHGPELGARMKVNPPIRPGQIEPLWDEVSAGRVAFVSSDHSSWPIDNKFTPSIFEAGAGVPGLETLLPAFFTGAEKRGLDAVRLTARQLSENPARFFGIWPMKGALMPGSDADIVILSRETTLWDSKTAHDELNWSPFDGREFSVKPVRTYVNGKLAWDGTSIANAPGDGRYVPRGPSGWTF
jgi:allantoinase